MDMLELSSTGANGGDYPQPTATRGDEAKYYKVVCILTNYRIVSSSRELSIRLLVGWLWCVEFVVLTSPLTACAYMYLLVGLLVSPLSLLLSFLCAPLTAAHKILDLF